MNDNDYNLSIKVSYKDKHFNLTTTDFITLEELKEISLKKFSLPNISGDLMKFNLEKGINKTIDSNDDLINNIEFTYPEDSKIELNLSIIEKNENKNPKIESSNNKEIKYINKNKEKDESIHKNIEKENLINNDLLSFKQKCEQYEEMITKLKKEIEKLHIDYQIKIKNLEEKNVQLIKIIEDSKNKNLNERIKELDKKNINLKKTINDLEIKVKNFEREYKNNVINQNLTNKNIKDNFLINENTINEKSNQTNISNLEKGNDKDIYTLNPEVEYNNKILIIDSKEINNYINKNSNYHKYPNQKNSECNTKNNLIAKPINENNENNTNKKLHINLNIKENINNINDEQKEKKENNENNKESQSNYNSQIRRKSDYLRKPKKNNNFYFLNKLEEEKFNLNIVKEIRELGHGLKQYSDEKIFEKYLENDKKIDETLTDLILGVTQIIYNIS